MIPDDYDSLTTDGYLVDNCPNIDFDAAVQRAGEVPGCSLAPIRVEADLAAVKLLNLGGNTNQFWMGIEKVGVAVGDTPSVGGWTNVVDGSDVPATFNIWNSGEPNNNNNMFPQDKVTVGFGNTGDLRDVFDPATNIAGSIWYCVIESASPSSAPSSVPSSFPSSIPSVVPSSVPSATPSSVPSADPSMTPSSMPSGSPSWTPSGTPSLRPSSAPSDILAIRVKTGVLDGLREAADVALPRLLDFFTGPFLTIFFNALFTQKFEAKFQARFNEDENEDD